MDMEKNRGSFRMLMLITSPKLSNKAAELFSEGHIPNLYQFHASGTASSEIMEMLGMGNIDKTVLLSMMPKSFADKMLVKLNKELHLGTPKSGIAFTAPILGGSRMLLKMKEKFDDLSKFNTQIPSEREVFNMSDCEYSMIMAIVNQGFSEEVMDAARPAGAAGGTVINSRRIVDEEAMKFWGINIQEEKEIIIILSDAASKLQIMKAICDKCGMKSEAHGIVFSVPVDNACGLY